TRFSRDWSSDVCSSDLRAMPARIRSLTLLNTLVDVDEFRRPWQMKPFAVPGLGRAWIALLQPALARPMFRRAGLLDQGAMTDDEIGRASCRERGEIRED